MIWVEKVKKNVQYDVNDDADFRLTTNSKGYSDDSTCSSPEPNVALNDLLKAA